jgi:hypothetical protein
MALRIASSSRLRPRFRVFSLDPLKLSPIAVKEEQAIVDTERDREHRHHAQDQIRDFERPREDEDHAEHDCPACECKEERQHRRHYGSEGGDEDQQ